MDYKTKRILSDCVRSTNNVGGSIGLDNKTAMYCLKRAIGTFNCSDERKVDSLEIVKTTSIGQTVYERTYKDNQYNIRFYLVA